MSSDDGQQAGGSTSLFTWIHRFESALDDGALRKAFETLIERHQILRTRFEAKDGTPGQSYDPELELERRACLTLDATRPDLCPGTIRPIRRERRGHPGQS